MGLKETIEKILEYEARSLSYSSRGTPIIWDEPQCKEDAEVERRIELLDRESVFEAVRKGFLLPKARIFIWVSNNGTLDLGIVQDDFFITLWVDSALDRAEETPCPEESIAQEVYRVACKKYQDERKRYQQALDEYSRFPRWMKLNDLKIVRNNLHPFWDDLSAICDELIARYRRLFVYS